MTAIVGILNNHAVAIAADSALTVTSNGRNRIYNTSRKIFPLTDGNPVAIMTYGNSQFMGVPWDVIISLYRKERGDRTFKTMGKYCEDFLSFLRKSDYFSGDDNQKWYFLKELRRVYDRLTEAAQARAEEEINEMDDPSAEQKNAVVRRHLMDVLKELPELCRQDGKVEGLKGCSFRKFEKITGTFWDEFMKDDEVRIDDDLKDIWHQVMYEYITSEFFYKGSGLVFIGYGSKDLFPSYHSIMISGIFDGRLRWSLDEHDAIDAEECTAMICPFGQDDVIKTMVNGIAPDLYTKVLEENEFELKEYRANVIDILKDAGVPDDVIAKVNGIDNDHYVTAHKSRLKDFIDKNYVDGIMDAVNSFNVKDLADMAGSLISVTNLQRHISSSEESVGGPVDVAVITKADGFKWVKHKEM